MTSRFFFFFFFWQVLVYMTTNGTAMASSMFQKKIDEMSYDIPNVFGIADDILMIF